MKKIFDCILRELPTQALYSPAFVAGAPSLPASRVEMLAQIESGQLDHLDVPCTVFQQGELRSPYRMRDEDLPALALSLVGQPFLYDHDQFSVSARHGTVLDSQMSGGQMMQVLRITTRQGMTDYVEGRIDRFSIAWYATQTTLCSICKADWLLCSHMPGRVYQVGGVDKVAYLIPIQPAGKEVSAVNAPASDGTGLLQVIEDFKLSIIGETSPAVSNARNAHPKQKGDFTMKVKVRRNGTVLEVEETEVLSTDERVPETDPRVAQIEANSRAAAELLGEHQRQAALDSQLQEQLQQSEATLVALCDNLLTSGLQGSRLPDRTQERIRKQFKGRNFRAEELTAAIEEAREEVSALTAPGSIQGPGRVGAMFSSRDQFRLAVEDLFGVERALAEKDVKVHRLLGIKDAYVMATGDQGFMGGFYPETTLVTANFPAIVANVMNKMLLAAWKDFEDVYGWWKKVATIEHFTDLNQVTWVKTGTIASLPTIAERGSYDELPIGDTKETSDWGKSGGYIPLTIEAVLRDDLRAFTRMPREAALAGIRNVSEKVAAVFTDNSGAGPDMNDTGKLFNATAQATLGGHLNLLTAALGTDYTAWNAVATAMFKKKMVVSRSSSAVSLGKPQGIKPSICLLPADLIAAGEALFLPRWQSNTNAIEPVGLPSYGGKVEPVAVPDWTDATDWAAVIDPRLVPGVMIGEIFGVVPQIFSASSEMDPAMFANDESRIKVRQFLAVGVADDMPLHKSNV